MIGTLSQLGILGTVALITGVLYVWLASRKIYAAWYFGIVSCAIIAYEDFTLYQLYADGVLQIFYIVMGGIALVTWRQVGRDGLLQIEEKPWSWHLIWVGALSVLGISLGEWLSHASEAQLPILDSWTSVMAVFATGLMAMRIRSNWLYWMVINSVYLFIYGNQGAHFYVVLTLVYLCMAVYGWFKWGENAQRT